MIKWIDIGGESLLHPTEMYSGRLCGVQWFEEVVRYLVALTGEMPTLAAAIRIKKKASRVVLSLSWLRTHPHAMQCLKAGILPGCTDADVAAALEAVSGVRLPTPEVVDVRDLRVQPLPPWDGPRRAAGDVGNYHVACARRDGGLTQDQFNVTMRDMMASPAQTLRQLATSRAAIVTVASVACFACAGAWADSCAGHGAE
jgi:hypothetical protein